MSELSFMEKIIAIQFELKAPKNQYNNFGKYKYRNCEDILEALKPLLSKYGVLQTIKDDMVIINERYYVKSIVSITDGASSIETTALARESETKKGMDDSQVTGAASSYARKYALNGMWLIDDTKDADSMSTHESTAKTKVKRPAQKVSAKEFDERLEDAKSTINDCSTMEELKLAWLKLDKDQQTKLLKFKDQKKNEINKESQEKNNA